MKANHVKVDCSTCGARDEYCRMYLHGSRCSRYRRKRRKSALPMVTALVITMLIFLCVMLVLTGCSAQPQAKAIEPVPALQVNDKVATKAQCNPASEQESKMEEEQAEVAELDAMTYEEPQPQASYECAAQDGMLTQQGGVNWYNGKKETYYSSNVLYHYMTPEWNCGSDGVWRDSDGYVILASSDMEYGTVHETSLGAGRVYDTGCPEGVVDVYVSW